MDYENASGKSNSVDVYGSQSIEIDLHSLLFRLRIRHAMELKRITLDPLKRSPEVREFEERLRRAIIGQDEAVAQFVGIYQTFRAGLSSPNRPVSNLLLLGPTGSGKTRIVEAAAEILFGDRNAFTKIDCAEFQHSHEIAKLIGSPPGYIGHRETKPIISQESIDRFQTETLKLSFLLFDEIEKASDALWQLLLGILDKGILTLGDNTRVDLSRTVVFMTSNLGAGEMGRLTSGGIGFAPATLSENQSDLAQRMFRVAIEAAKRRFSPEFMNRIDKVIVFRRLTSEDLRRILELELSEVYKRILSTQGERNFVLQVTLEAKEFLLREGTDPKYGARHLKRAIERHLVSPLSSLISTGQIDPGESITASMSSDGVGLVFSKDESLGQPESDAQTS
jgi:ATP-dependent Clp protease ATP-binding subunit ClpB